MSWFSNIISGGIDKIVDSVGNAIDKIITSDEEKIALKIELEKELNKHKETLVNQAIELDREITERHKNDMSSDSWLSKNIRPLTLIFVLSIYTLFSIGSGLDFKVTESYVELLGQWGMLIMSFYFGGRTLEKITSIVKSLK